MVMQQMSKEPTTIGELFIYMEGEFLRLQTEVKNLHEEMESAKNFTYWVAGISGASSATVFLGVCKIAGIL